MDKSEQQIHELQQTINRLQIRVNYLQNLLSQAGISYDASEPEAEEQDIYDSNQGNRIQMVPITDDLAVRFFAMFWGREDVYSKRTVKKSTGEASYYPQCDNFWTYRCPRKSGQKIKCSDCTNRRWTKLEKDDIKGHLMGREPDGTDVIGVYPLLPDGTCRFLVYDFDNHEKGAEKQDFANADDTWKEEVDALREICRLNRIDALVERSRSGRGAHVWIFFRKPVSAALARKFGMLLLRKGAEAVNLKSFRYYDRMIPLQDHIPDGGLGNLIALPLQGQALKQGNSAFVDENWNAYANQWEVLLNRKKLTEEFLNQCVKEWTARNPFEEESGETEKPWEKSRQFHKEDVEGLLKMTLANVIYIETANLKPRLQNQIRELAACSNPVFYRNQAIGLSNFAHSRYIYLGKDENGYIEIPRGLQEELSKKCDEASIEYCIEDKRSAGKEIRVEFTGRLRTSQVPAVEKMLEHDTGILSAATAFGKTVVGSNLIAQRKVSTLILLQASSLMEQWEKALQEFLAIEEEPPEYETATGRIRRRKSAIGKIQGAHDSSTGIIDIAMVGSLCKKGEFHPKLEEYGMVILDECHHAASDTIVQVLQEVRAKYVYGVTATPFRGDGLEKVNDMLLGPIRYRFSARERAEEQGIPHLVYPRFTRAVAPRFQQERMHPNEAYAILRNNEMRDEMILGDVIQCVNDGRTPVVLSRYKDHSKRLYDRLLAHADCVFLLSGENSQKEHREVIRQMKQVLPEQSMILVATGQLIGEGFDYPRLDTLIMATPVAGKGVVEQYAGRLNRDYEGKDSVIVYDYVDSHIPVFDRMYSKRLRAYKQIGFEIYSGRQNAKQDANAIYDIDSYRSVYKWDLLEANKEIIISSPAISADKVDEMMELLKEKQEAGLRIVIVTWQPDSYGYGRIDYWMELHERMRNAGFEMNLAEEFCEHFVIVDREIVWYGSMNFLAKEDAEDNLMRVCSREIAAELMELTFGEKKKLC